MRGAVVGSGLFHVALLVGLMFVRRPASTVVAGPDVVQVALLEPAAPAPAPAPTPPPPAPKPTPEKQVVKPDEAKGVRIAPPPKPKPAPPKAAPQAAPPPPPAPAAAPASGEVLPYAPVGNAGLRGQVSVDANDFEFTYYLVLVRNKIAQNWSPPTGAGVGATTRAVVYFRIERDGSIQGPVIESGSGVDFFDRTALRAVMLSDPLPALPLGYTGADLGVHFGFEYAAP
jgi:TonB family protein